MSWLGRRGCGLFFGARRFERIGVNWVSLAEAFLVKGVLDKCLLRQNGLGKNRPQP